MKTRLSTPLPDALRQEIIDARTSIERQLAATSESRKTADAKIIALEASAEELAARIKVLKKNAVTSEEAAGNLVSAERRALAIDLEIKTLVAERDAAPGVDLIDGFSALHSISLFDRDAIMDHMLSALKPFDYPSHLAMPMLAHAGAFQVCNIIRDWCSMCPPPDMGTIRRMFTWFDRALAGNINLHRDDLSGERTGADNTNSQNAA